LRGGAGGTAGQIGDDCGETPVEMMAGSWNLQIVLRRLFYPNAGTCGWLVSNRGDDFGMAGKHCD
jgi:hypothetical protein